MGKKENFSATSTGLEKGTMECEMTFLMNGLYKLLSELLGQFTVIREPDWKGGHFYSLYVGDPVEDDDLQDFEYIEWEGSAFEFCKLMDSGKEFMAHVEPLYEEAEDYPISAQRLFSFWLRRRIDNLISSIK